MNTSGKIALSGFGPFFRGPRVHRKSDAAFSGAHVPEKGGIYRQKHD
jgi:hypothetical protein